MAATRYGTPAQPALIETFTAKSLIRVRIFLARSVCVSPTAGAATWWRTYPHVTAPT